jgi:excinuclease ABC subunit B
VKNSPIRKAAAPKWVDLAIHDDPIARKFRVDKEAHDATKASGRATGGRGGTGGGKPRDGG